MELPISLAHVFVLTIVNLTGLVCFGAVFYVMQKKHSSKDQKTIAAIQLGLIFLVVLIVVFADIGVYLWIKSGNYRAIFMVVPMLLCVVPVFLPVVSFGAYIQLVYRDKIESMVRTSLDKNNSH